MSALDQAFIKAYRKGHEEPRRGQPTATATAWPPHAPTMTQPVRDYDPPHAAIPEPHVKFSPAATAAATGTHGMAPLSSFASTSTAAASRFEASYEVTRFTWPRRVEELAAEVAEPLANCGAALAARAMQLRKVQLVTGCQRGEGRSTLTLLLARAAAARGLRVVVVDADTRHPQLAELLGVSPAVGWEQVLARTQVLTEALVESALERVTLLPMVNPTALDHAGPHAVDSVQQLREHYDLILIDAGPLEHDAAAIDLAGLLLGCMIDDALVCCDRSQHTLEVTSPVVRRLAALGVTRWDMLENFVRRSV